MDKSFWMAEFLGMSWNVLKSIVWQRDSRVVSCERSHISIGSDPGHKVAFLQERATVLWLLESSWHFLYKLAGSLRDWPGTCPFFKFCTPAHPLLTFLPLYPCILVSFSSSSWNFQADCYQAWQMTGFVAQDTQLFSCSIEENLAYGLGREHSKDPDLICLRTVIVSDRVTDSWNSTRDRNAHCRFEQEVGQLFESPPSRRARLLLQDISTWEGLYLGRKNYIHSSSQNHSAPYRYVSRPEEHES